jgi:hypothetical protein
MRRLLLLFPLVVVAMTACGSDDDSVSDSVPVPTGPIGPSATTPLSSAPPDSTAPGPSGPTGTLRPVPGSVSVDAGSSPSSGITPTGPRGTTEELAALADLAQRQGVDVAAITVVSTDEVTWRDGSIGCPQPDMNYTQALVPGVRVVLELDGARYEYHAGGARSIFLCENPQAPFEG